MKIYQDNARKFSRWYVVAPTTNLTCCDCGLVHQIKFKAVPVGKKVKLYWKFRRHIKRTILGRKKTGVKQRQVLNYE